MKPPSQASFEYLRSAVMTASQEQLQLMLLDGAIRFSSRGREAIERGDIPGTFNALDRAQRITLELMNGMRREVNPALVDQMASLYDFVYRRLIDAHAHKDIQAVDDALRILRHQRETWAMLIDKIQRELAPAPAPATGGRAAAGHKVLTEEAAPSLSVEG